LLALELQELSVELNFDVTVIGFETAEADLLIQDLNEGTPDEADEVPEVDRSMPAVARRGDRWRIRNHVLLCGDALDSNNYTELLGAKKAQMVFTDPPYNVAIAGHVSGLGKVRHREFAMASGEMSSDEFTKFLKAVFIRFVDFSTNGSIHFICMDWRHVRELLDTAAKPYREISVSGRKPMLAWEAFTGHSMNWSSCSRTVAPRTSITSNWAALVATAPMSGTTRA